ncbi:MAG: hypothetical protein HFJ30_00460 [Clostridia bacterium]|nr:hypothetical protein [Clostridia bacterium]
MSDSTNLYTFPSTSYEALAMLYTQNQDLKGKSVQEIAKIYYDAYYEFRYQTKDIKDKASKKISQKFNSVCLKL